MAATLPLFSWKEARIRTLHYTWLAFFITFLIWFAHAALMPFIQDAFHLSDKQTKILLMLNVALTIPARIVVGTLVDRYGPRAGYSLLLIISGVLCLGFAVAQTFETLALMRFLLGFTGAGFVIGIRLVSEWFPAREVGLAEGVYGGWGNFGAAVASMALPAIALAIGGPDGWRYAVALTGVIAIVYGLIFYRQVRDTPKGATYFKPKKSGGLEVTSKRDLYFYVLMNIPLYIALCILAWRLSPTGLGLLSLPAVYISYVCIAALAALQLWKIWQVNRELFVREFPLEQRYKFKQVAILNMAYMACFGSELAAISMLPLHFKHIFGVSTATAGLMGGCFAVMNLIARPGGGWLSDRFGRRRTLTIALLGQVAGYTLLSTMNSSWTIPAAIALTLVCSLCVQASCGAVYSVVPLIQRRMTGQIAGMAGAYGNVGGVIFLTVLSLVTPATFFLVIAGVTCLALISARFLDEPRGHMVEFDENGDIQFIPVE